MLEGSGVITKLETDENGNLVLDFPTEILDALDWKEGDVLNIDVFAGRVIFQRVDSKDAGGTGLSNLSD
jgi:bifunctional DNA-binding transcriptional regulator/antitoxin component of YhaV-PrlF toxin-antitoxin module